MIRRAALGTTLFIALFAVTLVVSVLVVRERDPDLVLEVTEKPFVLRTDDATPRPIRFFVRHSDRDASIEILDEDGDVVRTLARDVELVDGREVTYSWDGRDDRGRIVPPESYYLRVELSEADRSMIWPKRIEVDPPPGTANG